MIYRMKVGALKRAADKRYGADGSAYMCLDLWTGSVAGRVVRKSQALMRGAWSEGREAAVTRLERCARTLQAHAARVPGVFGATDGRKPDHDVVLTFATHYVAAR